MQPMLRAAAAGCFLAARAAAPGAAECPIRLSGIFLRYNDLLPEPASTDSFAACCDLCQDAEQGKCATVCWLPEHGGVRLKGHGGHMIGRRRERAARCTYAPAR